MKKFNVFKVLTIAILVSIVLSYVIPGTSMNYGVSEKGTIMPVPFADTFTNGLTSLSAFMTIFVYVLVIGIFYAILKSTEKYDNLVNDIAAKFKKNRGLFVVLSVLVPGIITLFTGEILSMLVFVPLTIAIYKKLGFSSKTAVFGSIGGMIGGSSGAIYTYYINQMINVTMKDTLMARIMLATAIFVAIITFILVFNDRPESVANLEKSKSKKLLPLYIILPLVMAFILVGMTNWNGIFGYEGFDKFLETLRSGKIASVSIFNAIIGQSVVAFGSWQLHHVALFLMFITVLITIIYRIKIDDFFENVGKGIKKALPYAFIVVLANIVLVNVFSSGIFYTIAKALTEKTINITTGTLTAIISSVAYPDYTYATQFTLTSILGTTATNYQILTAALFQAIYSVFLLVSPTSIVLLLVLNYEDVRYKDWIKYIFKFFIVLVLSVIVIVTLTVGKVDAGAIAAAILLLIAIAIFFYLRISKVSSKRIKEIKKEEVKEEKKEVTTKTSTNNSKNTTKSNSKKSNTKKNNKK